MAVTRRACMVAFVVALVFLFVEGPTMVALGTTGGASVQRLREVRSFLKRVNKAPLKSIQSPDGDIIDCVPISKQPAFDHPLLKNHTIQMQPSYHPYGDSKIAPHPAVTQRWHQNGKCPENTTPIRRTKEEDVLRASPVNWFGKKRPENTHIFHPEASATSETHLATNIHFAELIPGRFTQYQPRLFIYWTRDAYQTTGCYNLWCSGFVQIHNQIAIGGTLSPQSVYGGTQYEFNILVWKDRSGDWWLKVRGTLVGYWPSSIFTTLQNSASYVRWGGEVATLRADQTSTQMGSGDSPATGYRRASYMRNIQVVNSSKNLASATGLSLISSSPSCYNVKQYTSNDWGTHIYYGGPRWNSAGC